MCCQQDLGLSVCIDDGVLRVTRGMLQQGCKHTGPILSLCTVDQHAPARSIGGEGESSPPGLAGGTSQERGVEQQLFASRDFIIQQLVVAPPIDCFKQQRLRPADRTELRFNRIEEAVNIG
uniref:Uncharacterized protein n=1 Tax=Calcidiscus leptoporus TaxID=127549 RepID=A0A7S0NTX7_9EUKA